VVAALSDAGMLIWGGIAAAAALVLVVLWMTVRRLRRTAPTDFGEVSTSWLVEYRANRTDGSP
jgi:hypothetical protein